MKKIAALLIFTALTLNIQAQRITPEQARTIAINFMAERAGLHKVASLQQPRISETFTLRPGNEADMYAVNFSGGGFVLVSSQENSFPVLAFSFESALNATNLPKNCNAWLHYFARQLKYTSQHAENGEWYAALHNHWLNGSAGALQLRGSRFVEPLLRTTWDQGNYYNGMCPEDPAGPGGRCWAGCVATAVGQLMFYHRWPEQGTGEYSYVHPVYGEQYANFGETTYNWNGMETMLAGPNDNIALLLYQLGVSFDMDYGPNGSGMWNHSAANSMRNYFKYGPQTQYIFRDTTTMNWDSILVTNLDARKPLYYAGWEGVNSDNGHAFVCDGYSADNFYHFNWGWGGSSDGYFLLSALNPGGNNFNFAQEVIKDIFPDTTQYTYPQYCTGSDTLNSISGTFSDGSNLMNYQTGADCRWLIQPSEPDYDSITAVTLNFPLLNLNTTDTLFVYNGVDINSGILARYTGTVTPPALTVPGNVALVRFVSSSNNGQGFLASYKSILPVYCSGTTTLTDSAGSLDDGSGAKRYSNNSICKWKIMPDNPVPLRLSFSSFNTEAGKDILRIYDLGTQQLLATLSGDSLPVPVVVPGGKAYLVFMTDGRNNGQGFSLDWAPDASTGVTDATFNTITLWPNPAGGTLTIAAAQPYFTDCQLQLYASSGVLIRSDHYSTELSPAMIKIETSGLAAGVYLIRLVKPGWSYSTRFVKK